MEPRTMKYTRKEIETRNRRHDAAVIIDNVVYDVTEFMEDHPGGMEVLMDNAGKDVSQCFADVGHSDIAIDWRKEFILGEVVDEERWPPAVGPVYNDPEPERDTLLAVLNVWAPPVLLAMAAILLYGYLFP